MGYLKRPMRRSALIGPWGVGAIVPFPNDESLMVAGLDEWRYNDPKAFIIRDERLAKRLGVSELRWPPDFRERSSDPTNCNLKIPTVRFPTWHYCPFCGQMKKTTLYETQPQCDAIQWKDGRKCSSEGKFRRRMIPERFIVVCPEGHIDDFPIAEWVHQHGYTYNPDTCKIRRSTGGASASLTGVYYRCTCGASRSMAGATRFGALERLGYSCHSSMPWLGTRSEDVCGAEVKDIKVLLRGATNVWFADTKSSISIPVSTNVSSQKIAGLVLKYHEAIGADRTNGGINRLFINMIAVSEGVNEEELYQAFVDYFENNQSTKEINENTTEEEYRYQEYKVLSKSSGNDKLDFHSISKDIKEYSGVLWKYFDSISLVPKLRETRAFVGFSRLESNEKTISERKKQIRLGGEEDWLPAIEVYGEGIFFKFNYEELAKWAKKQEVIERTKTLNASYQKSKFSRSKPGELKPQFILLHTFAHLVINQLSFECGYGSSAIRERIYCERTSDDLKMCGVLLYTASGDSEGSLGGLVRQGENGRLEDTIVNAIKNAAWCTSDPICIQSAGQGPESLNLAACHNCTLLPETCCETGNRLLDRGTVVGTLDNREIGYFSELLDI